MTQRTTLRDPSNQRPGMQPAPLCLLLGLLSLGGCSDEPLRSSSPHSLSMQASLGTPTTGWPFAQRLFSPEPWANDHFGISVAVHQNVAAIGAWHVDLTAPSGPTADAGAVYLYERSATGEWLFSQRLTAPTPLSGASFGFSLALSDNTLAVGALFEDVGAPPRVRAGAVHVFARDRSTGPFHLTTTLVASDGAPDDAFGFALALSGDSLLVGAPYADTSVGGPLVRDAGAAYVFARRAGGWLEEAKLVTPTGQSFDFFGRAVAISGDTALVGAQQADVDGLMDAGSALVFTRQAGRFGLVQTLTAPDKAARDLFGASVALDNDLALVGAYWADLPGGLTNAGAAYLFARTDGLFAPHKKLLAPTPARGDSFGASVAVFGERALVGAPFATARTAAGPQIMAGAGYLFSASRTPGETWPLWQILAAPDADSREFAGRSVALSADTAMLGAPGRGETIHAEAGAVQIFGLSLLERGVDCRLATDCRSGFCTDGVCCEQACGNGARSDCQSCRQTETGRPSGSCAPILRTAAVSCRASVGLCDKPELCDGLSTTCPDDEVSAAGTRCRAKQSLNTCDVDDVCDGKSRQCPALYAPESTPCRVHNLCGQCGGQGNCLVEGVCP